MSPATSATSSRSPLIVCVLALALLAPQARPARAAEALEAAFDWRMPDRFGLDVRTMGTGQASPDGVVDYDITFPQTWKVDEVLGSPVVNPSSWRVDLDARASRGAIVRYAWSVDGAPVGEGSAPAFTLEVPAEGKYSVTLTVQDAAGGSASTTLEVIVQDWLIVGVGDSYGSGEGNPEPREEEWIVELIAAQAEMQQAQADLAEAFEALGQARIHLEVTRAEVKPAVDALNAWNRECPSISVACAQATARLIAELAKLGFGEAGDLITQGFNYVKRQLDSLTQAAAAALAAAQASYDAAFAVVAGLEDKIQLLFEEAAVWQTMPLLGSDRAAHRSSLSGQALAALEIERRDPRTSVTFVHVSYSGARIVSEEGSSGLVDDQIDKVRMLVGNREIDTVLVSIGGNDAGFAKILTSLATTDAACGGLRQLAMGICVEQCRAEGLGNVACQTVCTQVADAFTSRCSEQIGASTPLSSESAAELLEEGLAKLATDDRGYPRLDEEFRTKLPALLPARVYITEYPNLVEDDDGSICPTMLTVTPERWRWIGEEMTVRINEAVRQGAADHGWRFIDGVYESFRGHGYCAEDHWVVRVEESFMTQGDYSGVAHPNAAGHRMYGRLIGRALASDLYDGGDLSLPRLPGGAQSTFRRGEVNDDGRVDIADVVAILSFLFLGSEEPGCLDAADANDDEHLQITDAVTILRHLFRGGVALPAPGPACGPDQTGAAEGGLSCARQESCR